MLTYSRRLGLCCFDEEELPQRKAIMAKYAEMAKMVFQTQDAVVSILKNDKEVCYTMDVSRL